MPATMKTTDPKEIVENQIETDAQIERDFPSAASEQPQQNDVPNTGTETHDTSDEQDQIFPMDKFVGILFLICLGGLTGMVLLGMLSNLWRGW